MTGETALYVDIGNTRLMLEFESILGSLRDKKKVPMTSSEKMVYTDTYLTYRPGFIRSVPCG